MQSLQTLASKAAVRLDAVDLLRLPETVLDITVDSIFETLEEETHSHCHEKIKEFRLRVIRGEKITDGEWGFFKFFIRLNAKNTFPCERDCWRNLMFERGGILISPKVNYMDCAVFF